MDLYTIQTVRLKLREVNLNDLQNIFQLHLLPETDQFNTMGIPEDISAIERMLGDWTLRQKEDPRSEYIFVIEDLEGGFIGLIGMVNIHRKFQSGEIWYKLHVNYWGRGFATEAVKGILQFGFKTLNLHRIEAGCAIGNVASCRVLEKAGFTREGGKRKALPIRGEWVDNHEYAILESDYE